MAVSLSTKGRPNLRASRLPTVDLPAPIKPTRTIGRSRRSDSFSISRGYTWAYLVGQKGRHVASYSVHGRLAPPDRRRGILSFLQRARSADQANRGRRQIVIGRRTKLLLGAAAGLAVALPALAQDQPESLLP